MGTLTNSWSFSIGDSNWKFCKVGYSVGTLKLNIQMWTFLTWDLKQKPMVLLLLSEKNQNLSDLQEQCIRKLGKIQSELKLSFGVYY